MAKAEFFVPEQPKRVRLELSIEEAEWLKGELNKPYDGVESYNIWRTLEVLLDE
jgi:hypothetical protein